MTRPLKSTPVPLEIVAILAAAILAFAGSATAAGERANRVLNRNAGLERSVDGTSPDQFTLEGDAVYGDPQSRHETGGRVVRFLSGVDKNRDGSRAGALSQTVAGITAAKGRWFRFRIRGLAQDGFHVLRDDIYLQVEFFRDGGKNSLDHIQKQIYPQIEQERVDLRDKATNARLGSATWRSYELEFRTPFPEVDTLRLTAGFGHGAGKGKQSEYWVAEFSLTPIADPDDFVQRMNSRHEPPTASKSLVRLGGRWYYDSRGEGDRPPTRFDHTNADRLFYRTDRFESPFAENMGAWLRKGYLDRAGNRVTRDQFVSDSVTVEFTGSHLVLHSHNLPNHPTAAFPDRRGVLDGNPNYIQEQKMTWYVPLEPRVNPDHVAMDESDENGALPGGPIGVAVNGVVFFNPFDGDSVEAIWRLDRCCGHPSPRYEYHYHKYPVCVKSPWTDDGTRHSPLIGFAFDGFPVYGPYESTGELAKDSQKKPLNAFNVHYDKERGWHYHVTPGKFPHILGGYWGVVDARNRPKRPPHRFRPSE